MPLGDLHDAVDFRPETTGQKGLELSGIHHFEGLCDTVYILSLVALWDDWCLGFVLFLTHFPF